MGAAKAAQEPRLSRSSAFAACWTALKLRYRIAHYEDLPTHQYRDAVAFVQHAYTQITGTPLVMPEQTELHLGDEP